MHLAQQRPCSQRFALLWAQQPQTRDFRQILHNLCLHRSLSLKIWRQSPLHFFVAGIEFSFLLQAIA